MEKEDLINHYFEKTLSEENQKEFNDLLANDKDFAIEVAFQINLKKAITLNERTILKQKLKDFETETYPKTKFKWQYIAASIVVFVACFWIFNQSPDSQELYDQYYQTCPNTIAPAVRGQQNEDLKSKAFYEYDAKNYQKSHQLFLSIHQSKQQDYALFYGAISLIELKKHTEALKLLNKFDLSKKNDFMPFIKWYKALLYLKLEQKQNTISLLTALSKTQNPQQELAIALLKQLE